MPAKQTRLRGGTKAEHASFTGAAREVTVESDTLCLRVHDGVTPGGHRVGNTSVTASLTTAEIADGATALWTISGVGKLSVALALTTDRSAWVRLYSSAAARGADTRMEPGGILPPAGSGYLLEVVTAGGEELVLTPPALLASEGYVYASIANNSGQAATIQLSLTLLLIEA